MTTLDYPVNALVSFHYYKRVDIGAMARGGLRMIGDSGAFSALSTGVPIDLGEFAEWATRWRNSLLWTASLDVIGDTRGTWKNYRTLRDRHSLDVIPTVHYGAAPTALDKYAADGVDFVGLGGMVGRKGQPKHLLRWCLSMFRYQRDNYPAMRFHGWGVTHKLLVNSLPWYSVDSSGAGAAYRYGRLVLYDPEAYRTVTVAMDATEIYKHANLLRKHYGVRPTDIASSTSTTRRALIRASARSNQLVEAHLRRKFNVSPPTYGMQEAGVGPKVHVALSELLIGPHIHFSLERGQITKHHPQARALMKGHTALADGKHENTALLDGPHVHYADSNTSHLNFLKGDRDA